METEVKKQTAFIDTRIRRIPRRVWGQFGERCATLMVSRNSRLKELIERDVKDGIPGIWECVWVRKGESKEKTET